MNLRQQLAADLATRISGSTVGIDRGHGCLMIDNKIFAFTRSDESAALKLPEARIAELIADDSEMHHLMMGKRTMREWLVVPNIAAPDNLPLLSEAKAYVTTLPQQKKRSGSAKKTSKKTTKQAAKQTTKKR